jgi:DNA/RNA-binding domain of Phe-tRNA-synthetase-like protein
MINIKISSKLKEICPNNRLGVLSSDIRYEKENSELWDEIEQVISKISNSLERVQIAGLPVIKHTREAYLALGKEPARYRCSAEALLRRVVQGKGLYRVNNVVDIINLISLLFHFSIGCYDFDKLSEPVEFDIGEDKESYEAIGRGIMNIAYLPTFRDSLGPFGSPTSDSERTMITAKTRNVLIAIIDFNGSGPLAEAMDKTISCLKQYADARNPQSLIIS